MFTESYDSELFSEVGTVASTDLKLKDMQEIAASIKEQGVSCQEFGKIMKQCSEETKRLKPLIGKPEDARPKGSQLIKVGIALIAFPDPTVSHLVGCMMVAAGFLRSRMQKYTAVNAYVEFRETMKALQKVTLDLGY
jgi:hypothetical protein